MPSVPTNLPVPTTPEARRRRNRGLAVGVLLVLVVAIIATWEVTRLAPQGAPAYEGTTAGAARLWAWRGPQSGFASVWSGAQGPNSTQTDLAPDAATGGLVAWDHGCAKVRPGFDGGCQNLVDATWTWDGHRWQQHHPALSPTASGSGVLVDDAHAGHVLYINGQGQVWAWTGTTWRRTATGGPQIPAPGAPSREAEQAFAAGYNSASGDLVIARSERTWLWDGATWKTRLGGIDVGDQGAGAELVDADGVMVYAGAHQTWTWNGTNWSHRAQPDLPTGSFAYDPTTHDVVLVAPDDDTCDHSGCGTTTWTWDGGDWTRSAPRSPARLPATRYSDTPPPLAYDAARRTLVLLVSSN